MKSSMFRELREEFWKEEKNLIFNKQDYVFVNGIDTLIATFTNDRSNWGSNELAWALAKLSHSKGIFMNDWKGRLDIKKILRNIRHKNLVFIKSSDSYKSDNLEFVCNDIRIYGKIYNWLSERINADTPSLKWGNVYEQLNIVSTDRKLCFVFYIPPSVKNSFAKSYRLLILLKNLIRWINSVRNDKILPHYDVGECVHRGCTQQVLGRYSNIFNLPLCEPHLNEFDRYSLGQALADKSLDFSKFRKDSDYRELFKIRVSPEEKICIVCDGPFLSQFSINICDTCLRSSTKTIWLDMALGITNRSTIKDNLSRYWLRMWYIKGKCPDCGVTVTSRKTICPACESRYDWDRIQRDLNNGLLSWDKFCSDENLRQGYRLSGRRRRRRRRQPTTSFYSPHDSRMVRYFGSSETYFPPQGDGTN